YGILFARIFDTTLFASLSDGSRVTADTLLSTAIVLFSGEFLPKTIFKSNPNSMLNFFAIPAYCCYVLLYPVSRFATLLSRGLLRLIGVTMPKESEGKEFTKVTQCSLKADGMLTLCKSYLVIITVFICKSLAIPVIFISKGYLFEFFKGNLTINKNGSV
ncbi:MAG: DUF21 domain-containing protein, partial [Lachnospiraceae bacterium]|nr:DUF21 domain-containing protein [Lachnospiraceae bacterium]